GLLPTENALLAPKAEPKKEVPNYNTKMDEVVENAVLAADETNKRLGAAFENAVIDNTGKIHFQTNSGKTFTGNQYRTVESLSSFGKTFTKLSNANAVLGLYFDGVEVHDGWIKDGRQIGENTVTQVAGAAGSAGGAYGGAIAGAEMFSFAGPWGMVIGGIVGGIGGAIFGESAAELGSEMYFQGNNQGGVSIDLNWKLFESGKDNTRLNTGPTF
ncbi:MAG: hypothetical protein RLZZ354_65, partial [Pseudomonadota bacterium]